MKPTNDHMVSSDHTPPKADLPVSSPLGRKQLFFILLFSSLVTLLGTSVQLAIEYRNDIGAIYEQLNQIEKGYLPSLIHNLWKLDDAQLEIELKNMLTLRDVVALEIVDAEGLTYRSGEAPTGQKVMVRQYEMIYDDGGALEKIGTLNATASLSGTYHRLGKRILIVLVTQGIKTFLVSLFILFVIHLMVTRHLGAMAKYVRSIVPGSNTEGQLTLVRTTRNKDELDEVVQAINGMEKRLHDDIEQRKELESQLAQSHKMEAIGTLAGGIAHDFNNILTIIMGNAELAVQSLPTTAVGRQEVVEICKASHRAKEMIAQLLKFSRKMDIAHIPIDPRSIVEEVQNLLRSLIPPNIILEQEIEKDIWTIRADPTQIHQVILNLCTNALQAMESRDGLLVIRLTNIELEDETERTIKELAPGKHVRLEISDSGEGIAKENLSKIFDPYFTTKSLDKGTGMGLSVVQGIVSSHRGAIDVKSSADQGTTVRVYLPAQDGKPSGMTEAKDDTPHTPIPSNAKVFLVDDEPQVLKLGKTMIEKLGYTVEVSSLPREALSSIRAAPDRLDLLMTDFAMPAMTGLELASAVHELRQELPIVLCSGYSMKIDPTEIEATGVTLILEKPFTKAALSKALREALQINRN